MQGLGYHLRFRDIGTDYASMKAGLALAQNGFMMACSLKGDVTKYRRS